MNAYFSSFEFQPHNFITNVETSTLALFNLGIYEQDDGLTGDASGLTIQALETATEDSALALSADCVVTNGSFCQGAAIGGIALAGRPQERKVCSSARRFPTKTIQESKSRSAVDRERIELLKLIRTLWQALATGWKSTL